MSCFQTNFCFLSDVLTQGSEQESGQLSQATVLAIHSWQYAFEVLPMVHLRVQISALVTQSCTFSGAVKTP